MDHMNVAIATMWNGANSYSCAVLHWCEHAQNMADVLVRAGARSAELLVVLTARQHGTAVLKTDCPQARTLQPRTDLLNAVDAFSKIGCKGSWAGGITQMYKWHMFSLVQVWAWWIRNFRRDVLSHCALYLSETLSACVCCTVFPNHIR